MEVSQVELGTLGDCRCYLPIAACIFKGVCLEAETDCGHLGEAFNPVAGSSSSVPTPELIHTE